MENKKPYVNKKREDEENVKTKIKLEKFTFGSEEDQRKIKIKEEILVKEDPINIEVVDGLVYEDFSLQLDKISVESSLRQDSNGDSELSICKGIQMFQTSHHEKLEGLYLDHVVQENRKKLPVTENSIPAKVDLFERQNSYLSFDGAANIKVLPNSKSKVGNCENVLFRNCKTSYNLKENKPNILFCSGASFNRQMSSQLVVPESNSSERFCAPQSPQFMCEICHKYYNTRNLLTKHIKTHSVEKPFVCKICEKHFKRNTHLVEHMITHSDEKPFACDICHTSFKRKKHLNTHKLSHSEEKPNECTMCEKRFTLKVQLRQHMITHSNEKPFMCKICEKPFKEKGKLKKHMVSHSDLKPFGCKVCEKQFKRRDDVGQHMKSHSDEEPFSCEICEKSFKRKADLGQHMLCHSEENVFSCDICEKPFLKKAYLKLHMVSHSDEKPFVCKVCKKDFKTKGALGKHAKRTH